mgnify:CR=1 FL=1
MINNIFMCGIIGIHSIVKNEKLFNEVFEGLMCLQHRGQDSVGISNEFCIRKYNGLVKYAFQNGTIATTFEVCHPSSSVHSKFHSSVLSSRCLKIFFWSLNIAYITSFFMNIFGAIRGLIGGSGKSFHFVTD